MAQTLIRTFDRYDHAEAARAALVAADFPPTGVLMDIRDDEAGPPDAQRSSVLLTVAAADEEACRRAAEILARFGARDPDTPAMR